MRTPARVEVELGERSYAVIVGAGATAAAADTLADALPEGRVALLTDARVSEPWGSAVHEALSSRGVRVTRAELPPGEGAKTLGQVEWAGIVLDDMITQVLLAQAARAEGFEITEADLKSRIDALASDVGGADALAAWQSAHGYTVESFQSALKLAAEAAWMRDKIITAVPGTMEQVHAQQILLYNEDAAQTVAGQLAAGSNFADLAALYDPNTAGELGWFPRGYLLEPTLEEVAFSLEPGQYSDVVETEVGFHILMVLERDLQHPLSPDAYLVMQENALQDWLEQERATSEIVLAP